MQPLIIFLYVGMPTILFISLEMLNAYLHLLLECTYAQAIILSERES